MKKTNNLKFILKMTIFNTIIILGLMGCSSELIKSPCACNPIQELNNV